MSNLTPLEQHVLSYYAAGQGRELNIATRWYPYGELVMILEDKMGVAVRKFGRKAVAASRAAATAYLDAMIAAGAWTSKQNDFGGAMHQFQADVYRTTLTDMLAADPLATAAAAGDDTFWADAFAKLTS
jgi:hypothetical protein